MTQFLQERIQPQEVLRLVLGVVLVALAAYFGAQKFITPDIDTLTTRQNELRARLQFTEQQIGSLEDIGDLSFLRSQLAAARAEIEAQNLTVENEIGNSPVGPLVKDLGEMKIGKVNEAIGRSGIFVRSSAPGGVKGDRGLRTIVGEGRFNSVIRALSGMEFLDVLVTGVVLERIPDSDALKVTFNLAI